MSKRITCIFKECRTPIIKHNDKNSVKIDGAIYERFKLMQPTVSHNRSIDTEKENSFLVVEDIWDFDNIGVSKELPPLLPFSAISSQNTSPSPTQIQFEYENETWYVERCIKYLICAECDRGPIGMMCEVHKLGDDDDDDSVKRVLYLLSLQSVRYGTDDA